MCCLYRPADSSLVFKSKTTGSLSCFSLPSSYKKPPFLPSSRTSATAVTSSSRALIFQAPGFRALSEAGRGRTASEPISCSGQALTTAASHEV